MNTNEHTTLNLLDTQSTERRWGKSITFDLKGELNTSKFMPLKVLSIIKGKIEVTIEQQAKLRNKLETIDFSNYYTGVDQRGPKVTKLVRKALKELFVDKAIYEPHFPAIAKEISELYLPLLKLTAFWGRKSLLGSGEWESSFTCFNNDGCNATSGKFIQLYPRTQVLVLASLITVTEKEFTEFTGKYTVESDVTPLVLIYKDIQVTKLTYSRCIAYFLGGRRIHLTNFYYNGLPQNPRIHIEALRRLLGLHTVTFSNEEVDLPIYLNSDAVLVKGTREKIYRGKRKFPCPHCLKKVDEGNFYHKYDGNDHYLGCSKECSGENTRTCYGCECSVSEDDLMVSESGDNYCSDCYNEHLAYCEGCNNEVSTEDYYHDIDLCTNCATECRYCHTPIPNDNILEHDGYQMCEDCFNDRYSTCDECSSTIDTNDIKDNLCPECHEQKCKDIKEVNDEAKMDEERIG